jgi:hypothetical protein
VADPAIMVPDYRRRQSIGDVGLPKERSSSVLHGRRFIHDD